MKVLVTGGGGFLGTGIVRRLLARGDCVTVLGRRNYVHLGDEVIQIQADIRDKESVLQATKGQDAVFHVAAVPGIWGSAAMFNGINVEGTRNVIESCRSHAVKKLIFTSSPSVIYDGTDMENVDESVLYPNSYQCDYPRTKAMAELLVLGANGLDGLATVSLRPHLIWGPEDPHLVPRLLDRAKKRRLIQVGSGKNKVDIIYIDNAVEAHLLACDALDLKSPVAGRCYFLSDGHPVILWEWINELLQKMELPPVKKTISYQCAKQLGGILEWGCGAFKIKSEPPMTRFLASQLATSHYFDISNARKDFSYAPIVDQEEGMNRLIRFLKARPAY